MELIYSINSKQFKIKSEKYLFYGLDGVELEKTECFKRQPFLPNKQLLMNLSKYSRAKQGIYGMKKTFRNDIININTKLLIKNLKTNRFKNNF